MKRYLNKTIIAACALFVFTLGGQAIAAESWDDVANKVGREQDQAVKAASETTQMVVQDEASLKKELADLQAQERSEQAALTAVETEFANLKKQAEGLKTELSAEQEEIDSIEGSIRGVAKDALEFVRDNPITAEYPDRVGQLNELISMRRFPGLDGIKVLTALIMKEIAEEGTVVKRTGEYVDRGGKVTTGEIIRIGRWTSYYKAPDGTVGFVNPDSEGKRLIALTTNETGDQRKAIKGYFEGGTTAIIDPSAGSGFSALSTEWNLWDWMETGGPVMYVIFAVGILAGLIIIERTAILMMKSTASNRVMDEIKRYVEKGQFKDARNVCASNKRVPTCQMLDPVLGHVEQSQEVLENAMQESIMRQAPKLERFMGMLALLGTISPLLGLLGTVTGMITTFNVITSVGTGDPTLMAGGISEALLTTEFGLILAIPIMVIHHLLQRRVDSMVGDMQEKGTAFAVTLLKQTAMAEG